MFKCYANEERNKTSHQFKKQREGRMAITRLDEGTETKTHTQKMHLATSTYEVTFSPESHLRQGFVGTRYPSTSWHLTQQPPHLCLISFSSPQPHDQLPATRDGTRRPGPC